MRCECDGKFHGLETEVETYNDPELQVDEEGKSATVVVQDVTINRNCDACGQTLKSASLDAEQDVDFGDLPLDKIDWSSLELDTSGGAEETESGGGRYKKNMIGFSWDCDVTGKFIEPVNGAEDFTVSVTLHDETPASSFDEC